MNENIPREKNTRLKFFIRKNRESFILLLLILFTVLLLIYKIYEINYNKLFNLNIDDKNKISVTKNDESFYNYVNNGEENNISDDSIKADGVPLFILSEKDGKMALYSGDRNETVQIYDVYIDTLPEFDKKELEAGIPIYDLKDLDSLIEDFTS